MIKKKVKNFLKGELIGLVIEAPLNNIKGKIIDETKNTFTIINEKKQRRKILKNQELIFKIDNKKIIINGKILEVKPEERIKLAIK